MGPGAKLINYTRVLWGSVGLWMWVANVFADSCSPWVTRVVSVQGTVEVKRSTQSGWSRANLHDELCAGDIIRTDIYSRAGLLLRNETVLRLDQRTTLVLPELDDEDSAWLNLLQGAIHLISNVPYHLKIKTPFVNAAMEGTEFAVRVSESDTKVWVVEGQVLVENAQGTIRLGPGKAALTEAGKAPAPYLKMTPRDAVQWALYYPPIIDYRAGAAGDPERRRAVSLYRTGQIPAAIQTLNAIADSVRDSGFFTQRAAILLSVGDIQAALGDIDQALVLSPHSGAAVALQSIVALTRNDKEQARSLAEKAVELEPKSPAPRVALSFARQAAFDIEGARESIQKALELSPEDPLAWARLSELELSTGNLDEALEAARKAEALDPELSHTQMVLGFAQLLQIDVDEAKESFNKAINLDPSAPLPRLGMGLAKIREGNIDEGTKDIEVAAVLDPENSLVRSYLGKAYYEEKRGSVASREFGIAKELDPKDPTPWFYDAIHKQTTNRPVEALHDMQKAIELNDNRAVYRSSLLLDDDLAARSASLGRIYNDLGFQQRGLLEGWKSVTTEPSNYSAHRLLADNYAVLPRHEVARVSELLQSQLLQPLNITPVQPELAVENLLVLSGTGPGRTSFNEFNPLFNRNRVNVLGSGILGNNDRFGEEFVNSAVWNNYSYSLGQFHFENDGYRQNNDINQNIYNAFIQSKISEKVNVQAEYRYRDAKFGDLQAQFDTNNFSRNLRQYLRRNSLRIGANIKPESTSNILLSAIYNDDALDTLDFSDVGFPFGRLNQPLTSRTEAVTVELQYLKNLNGTTFVLGGGYRNKNNPARARIESALPPSLPLPPIMEIHGLDFDGSQTNTYLYSYWPIGDLQGTLGLSYDALQSNGRVDRRRINPKIGLIWQPSNTTVFRAAYVESISRLSSTNQTIEPIQVAGFSQYFDDLEGTTSQRAGIGLDLKFNNLIYVGAEGSYRKLYVPLIESTFDSSIGTNTIELGQEKQIEKLVRGYFYWTPLSSLALSLEYLLEYRDRSITKLSILQLPKEIITHQVPFTISYYAPNGFFLKANATFVEQQVTQLAGLRSNLTTNKENGRFFTVNSTVGFRLPNRWGIVEFSVRNLFNEKFQFADINLGNAVSDFVTLRSSTPRYVPERTLFGQITLNYDL